MVYFMENPIKMDDLGEFPPTFGNIHIHHHCLVEFWYFSIFLQYQNLVEYSFS